MSTRSVHEHIPDSALVLRGGNNSPASIARSALAYEQEQGIAVVCAAGRSFEELCRFVPHAIVGSTTVGTIRASGGDVVRRPGGSPYHAILIGVNCPGGVREMCVPHSEERGGNLEAGDRGQQRRQTPPARIYGDFLNVNMQGWIRLNTRGTIDDLQEQGISLYDGLTIILDDGDGVAASAVVHWDPSATPPEWVAEIDWSVFGDPWNILNDGEIEDRAGGTGE